MDMGWRFKKGDVVKIRLFNNPKSFHPMNHPFHMHGQRFLVLSMDGVPNTNMVWKDTAIIPVGSTVDILLDADNPGKWMAHCHIAEHLHAGMMTYFEVVDEDAAQ
jgi:FtsP/CotA-like multicopper oxidase with cupredoxin domain